MQISEVRMQNCEFGGQRARDSERNIEPGGRQLVAQGAAASAAEPWVD